MEATVIVAMQWRNWCTSDLFYIFELLYITIHNIEPNELHSTHLGTSMYMLGSVLWLLVFQVLDGTPQANLDQVWGEDVDDYKDHNVGTRFSNLEVSIFHHNRTHPNLSGKGAEIKELVPAVHYVWKLHCNPALRQHALVDGMLHSQCCLQGLLAETKEKCSCHLRMRHCLHIILTMLLSDTACLPSWQTDKMLLLWKITPKHH